MGLISTLRTYYYYIARINIFFGRCRLFIYLRKNVGFEPKKSGFLYIVYTKTLEYHAWIFLLHIMLFSI